MSRILVPPPALPPGGTLGIVSPCGPVREDALERGRDALHALGFRTVVAPHARDQYGHLAGADADRAEDLATMFADPAVDAVICARGGSGSIRLLPLLDWERIRAHPKPFLGYSDATTIHLALHARCGFSTFFAPMVASDFAPGFGGAAVEVLVRMLTAAEPSGSLRDPRCAGARVLRPGIAEGPLAGGTLSLVVALLGTPYEIDTEGCLLFFEDVHESPAHWERFLMQLLLAGKLQRAAGIVIGTTRWEPDEQERSRYLTFDQVFDDLLPPLGIPVVCGWPSGHLPNLMPLPLGVSARLDTDRAELTVLGPAVH